MKNFNKKIKNNIDLNYKNDETRNKRFFKLEKLINKNDIK